METPKPAPRILSLQILRGLAALYVVLFHGYDGFVANRLGPYLGGLFNKGWAGVDFFFVLSGFVIFWVHGKDVGQPGRIARFALRRLSRIYPLYWVVLTLRLLVFWRQEAHAPGTLLAQYALWPLPLESRPLAVSWTLSFEVFFYLIFGLAILTKPKVAKVLAFGYAAVLAAVAISGVDLAKTSLLLYVLFDKRCLEFLAGVSLAALVRADRTPPPWASGLGFLALFAAGHLVGPERHAALLFGASAWCLIAFGIHVEKTRSLARAKPLLFLGDASYSIYLVHATVIGFTVKWMLKHGKAGLLTSLPGQLLLPLLGVLAGVACYLVVEKPLLKRSHEAIRRWEARKQSA